MLAGKETPTEPVFLEELKDSGVQLSIRRLDKIHPLVSGNKFYKLKYNLEACLRAGKKTILTFGGAYSNHILACAEAAKSAGLQSIGIIRGEEHNPMNPTLQAASSLGMKLTYMQREIYRKKNEKEVLEQLQHRFGDFYLLPEGGTNQLAIQGTAEILQATDKQYDHIACGVGTGGTMAGILSSIWPHQQLWGFSALKGSFIVDEFDGLLKRYQVAPNAPYHLFIDYHFGGYARFKPELISFIHRFKKQTGIPLDPIYTGKMMFGLVDAIQSGKFERGSHILAIHSGGLQGIQGFNQMHGTTLSDF